MKPVVTKMPSFRDAWDPARKGPDRQAQEREFLPAMLEVIETPASPTLRMTALILCGLFAATLAWACLAEVDVVAVAPGEIVPRGQVKVVQPLETAIVRSIHVDDGDHVTAGQVLVELDPTEAQADLGTLLNDRRHAAIEAEIARAIMGGPNAKIFVAPHGLDAELIEASRGRAWNEAQKHRALIQELRANIEEKRAAIANAALQIERDQKTLPLMEERLKAVKALWDARNGPRPPVLDAEQVLIERRAQVEQLKAATRQSQSEIAALEARIAQAEASFLADATERRTKALQKVSNLSEEIARIERREKNRRLVAPVAGTIEAMKLHTPGAVVTSADTLMTIVPDDADIEIKAEVQNADIGFVHQGQDVEIKVDAFPFTKYGLIEGRIERLGRDAARRASAVASPTAGLSELKGAAGRSSNDLAYPAKVTLAQDWILAEGRRQKLHPGMRVSVEIKTGKRRVIEYVLSPILQTAQEAGRER